MTAHPDGAGSARKSRGLPSGRAAQRPLDIVRYLAQNLLPERVYQAQQALRRAPLFRRHGVVFIHVPKNAGAAISFALYGRFVGHVSASDLQTWAPGLLRKLPSFAVTRNPWDRCLSAYRFARAGGGRGDDRTAQRIDRAHLYRTEEFNSFSRFLNEWLPRQDLRAIDPVFRPQMDYIAGRDGRVAVDHVGRVEDIDALTRSLSAIMDRPITLQRMNETTPASDAQHRRAAYSRSDIDIVAAIYAEDIRRFGYDF